MPKEIYWHQIQHRQCVSIEIVKEYTYLGTRLTPTGNFTLALEHLKEKALHTFSSIQKQTILNKLNPNTESQILDTIIFSILYSPTYPIEKNRTKNQ